MLRLTSMLGITITGLVYVFVLGPQPDPQGLGWWTNAGLHYVAPVLAVVLLLAFRLGDRKLPTTAEVSPAAR